MRWLRTLHTHTAHCTLHFAHTTWPKQHLPALLHAATFTPPSPPSWCFPVLSLCLSSLGSSIPNLSLQANQVLIPRLVIISSPHRVNCGPILLHIPPTHLPTTAFAALHDTTFPTIYCCTLPLHTHFAPPPPPPSHCTLLPYLCGWLTHTHTHTQKHSLYPARLRHTGTSCCFVCHPLPPHTPSTRDCLCYWDCPPATAYPHPTHLPRMPGTHHTLLPVLPGPPPWRCPHHTPHTSHPPHAPSPTPHRLPPPLAPVARGPPPPLLPVAFSFLKPHLPPHCLPHTCLHTLPTTHTLPSHTPTPSHRFPSAPPTCLHATPTFAACPTHPHCLPSSWTPLLPTSRPTLLRPSCCLSMVVPIPAGTYAKTPHRACYAGGRHGGHDFMLALAGVSPAGPLPAGRLPTSGKPGQDARLATCLNISISLLYDNPAAFHYAAWWSGLAPTFMPSRWAVSWWDTWRATSTPARAKRGPLRVSRLPRRTRRAVGIALRHAAREGRATHYPHPHPTITVLASAPTPPPSPFPPSLLSRLLARCATTCPAAPASVPAPAILRPPMSERRAQGDYTPHPTPHRHTTTAWPDGLDAPGLFVTAGAMRGKTSLLPCRLPCGWFATMPRSAAQHLLSQ